MWYKKGNQYRCENIEKVEETLPFSIYEVGTDVNGFYLNKVANKFEFNGKLYDVSNGFSNYFISTFNNTNSNIGVLLTGLKGTGKTYVAKEICNKLKLPVIIVKYKEGIIDYLSTNINFDCIFFFDEYDKEFEDDTSILSFMDGASNNSYRKVFLLTTNNIRIDTNLLGRPSRIRYIKQFGNLSEDIVKTILNDYLIDKTLISSTLEYLSNSALVTIDIVKTLAEELNIHKDINAIKDIFNLTKCSYAFSVEYSGIPYVVRTLEEAKTKFPENANESIVISNSIIITEKFNKEHVIWHENNYVETIDSYGMLYLYKVKDIQKLDKFDTTL